jgi:hypothetical protein
MAASPQVSAFRGPEIGRVGHPGDVVQNGAVSSRTPHVRILVLSLLVTVTLVAWGVLVMAAIDFGREARSGEPDAWTFLGIAAAGATACLFVAILLVARLVALARGPARERRVRGGSHRTSR